MKTPLEGATSVINAAVNPELAGVSGMYYKDCKDGYKTSVAKYIFFSIIVSIAATVVAH